MFQSLRGFGVGWSIMAQVDSITAMLVSIPERVWGGLELDDCHGIVIHLSCFNP